MFTYRLMRKMITELVFYRLIIYRPKLQTDRIKADLSWTHVSGVNWQLWQLWCQSWCSPAWSGFCSVKDPDRINSFIKRSRPKRSGYCADEVKSVSELFADADKTLLKQVLAKPNHTLHQFLPPINNHDHHLRKRPHNHQLPAQRTIFQQSNFIIRSLFRDTY